MMRTARARTSERSLLLIFVLTAAAGTVPTFAHAVNEFPSPPPPRRGTSVVQSAPTQRMYVPAAPVLRAPDLIGQPLSSARATLEGLGLRAGSQVTQTTTDGRPGTVLGQDPKPGTPVKPGQAVNLWIAAAPAVRDPRLIPGNRVRPEVVAPAPRPDDVGVAVPLLTTVPQLTGQPTEHARDLLARARLTLGERRAQPSDAPAGTVLGQSPAAGSRVRPGTGVDVFVSVAMLVSVPDVTGRSAEDARQLLARYKLALGNQQRRPSDAATGTVVGQSPAAGTHVRPGTSVDVSVASPILVSVPDVTGRSAAEARQLLDRSRLGLGESLRRESEATVGSVLSQSPAAGARVPPGTSVDVVVADARPVAATPTVPPPARPPGTPRPDEPAPAPATPVATPPAPTPGTQPPVARPPVAPPPLTPTPRVPTPASQPEPVAASPVTTPAPQQPSVAPPPRALEPASPPHVVLPSPPAAAPAAEPTPGSPLRLHWGVAAALVLGATAGFISYRRYRRGRSTRSSQQSPAPSLALGFAPRWDPGRQQIGPAGPLSDGSGLRLISRLDIGTPRLEDEDLVGAAATNGGLSR